MSDELMRKLESLGYISAGGAASSAGGAASSAGAAVVSATVVAATTGAVPSRLGIVSQLPALSLFGSLPMKASGFAAKIALTAGQSFTVRFSMRRTMSDSVSPGCTV